MSKDTKDWLMWCVGAIFTLICVIAVPALATNMVTNDRIRAQEDKRIENKVDEATIQVAKLVECTANIKDDLREIKVLLRRALPKE